MTQRKTHRKVYIIGGIAAAVMFGFCFAMVPLYGLICKSTGINTVSNKDLITAVSATTSEPPDMSRLIKVQFLATNHNGMPWEFFPLDKSVEVHPGENKIIYYYAKNTTEKVMSVQAIPSMTPTAALGHFHKIECFCFNQQTLKPGESKKMKMIFRIDKEISKDTHVISLAYTLFDTTTNETRKG